MLKKKLFALISLLLLTSLFLISLKTFAQNIPSGPVLPQSDGLLTENDFGEPDITVDSTADTVDANPGDGLCADASDQCTLRAAIMEANALDFSVTIYAPAGTYDLTLAGIDEEFAATGDLDIRKPMTIYGDGPQATIIDAHQLDRVFHIMSETSCARTDLLSCFPFVWVSDLTIQGGSAIYGGGVYQQDQWAFFTGVDFINNYASSIHPCTVNGGAAYLNLVPQANIAYSRFINNHTPSTSTSSEMQYGVIAGHAMLSYVTIDQNDADWALVNSDGICDGPYDGQFVLSNTSITRTTGGAVYAQNLEMSHTTISTNGAGIHLYNPSGRLRTMVGRTYEDAFNTSTIANNTQFGIKLDDVYVPFDDLVIANNGVNCVGTGLTSLTGRYEAGVATDESCSLVAHRFEVDSFGTGSLTQTPYRYYHAISSWPASGRGDTGLDAMPLQVAQVRSTRYHDDAIYTSFSDPTLPSNDQLFITFKGERLLYNPPGDTEAADATNPNNYQLIMPGDDSTFQTNTCNSLGGDDVLVPIEQLAYFDYLTPTKYMYNLYVGPGVLLDFDELAVGGTLDRLPAASYRLLICGTLQSATSDLLDGDDDGVADGQPYIFDFTSDPLPYPSIVSSFALVSDEQVDIQVEFDTLMDAYQLLGDEAYHTVVYAGENGVIDTQACDTLAEDDQAIAIESVKVGTGAPNITFDVPFDILQVAVARPLSPGPYAYILCDLVHDVEGAPLDGDGDDMAGGNHVVEFAIDALLAPEAPTLNDYSDVLVALNLPNIEEAIATEFQIERSGGGTTAIVGSSPLDLLTFVDSNLTCETAYRYRIRLYHEPTGTFSDWSDYLDVTTANCVTSLQHTFGLYKEGQWLFYAVDGYQRDDVRFQFGEPEPGWTALVGDWNGDGIPGIGLYKNGTFMLRDLDGTGVADVSFDFGPPTGAVPLVGDWDGNGSDTIGVFVGGTFHLRNSNDTGPADLTFSLGSASSQPLAGDWDGDGTDSVGYFENNIFNLATSGVSPTVYTSFSFGPLGWLPVFGDWNGDLTDTIGLYNDGLWRLRNTNDAGPVDYGFSYGDLEGGWQPLAFDGDTSVLNRLFNATVPTPRVPVIPGPGVPIDTLCDLHSIGLEFVGFDSMGDVRYRFINNRPVVSNLVEFVIVWPLVPGLQLEKIVVGGSSANDIQPSGPGVIVWEGLNGADDYPISVGSRESDGNWLSEYAFPPHSTTDIHLDFAGFGDDSLDQHGVTQYNFNSTWFEMSCGPDTNNDGNEGSDQPVYRVWSPAIPPYATRTRVPNPTASSTPEPTRTLPPPTATLDPSPAFSCDKISVDNLEYGPNSITLTIRNDNTQDTVLTGSYLIWNDAIIKPDFPNIYLGYLHINEDAYWSGTDSTSPTNTFTEGNFNTSANREISAVATANWQAVFVNGPVFLQPYLFPWDFSGSFFYFDHPTEATDCEVPLTVDPEPESTNTPVPTRTQMLTTPTPIPSWTPNMTPPTATNTPTPEGFETPIPDCSASTLSVEFVSFDSLGDVRFRITNNRTVVSYLIDFYLVWPQNIAGLKLQRVIAGGASANDVPPGVIIWQNTDGDTTSPSQGTNASDGQWLMDYTFPTNSSTFIHFDFTGTGAPALDELGASPADFNGTWFEISCGDDEQLVPTVVPELPTLTNTPVLFPTADPNFPPPTYALGWQREFVNLSDVGCPTGSNNTDNCADWYFDAVPMPTTSTNYSFVGMDDFIVYPDYIAMRAQPGAAALDADQTAGRWKTTTALVGPGSIGGVIAPGVYQFRTISDDGVRMRYEVASGPCTLEATPDLPLLENEWNIIDNWTYSGDTMDIGLVLFESGCTYNLELQWFEGGAGETIYLYYELASSSAMPLSTLTPTLDYTPPTSTNTPEPTDTPGPDYTPPTATMTPTSSDTPEYTATPWPTETPLANPVCPSLEFSCQQLFDCEEAYACYDSGNTSLDADNDGVPCEVELACTPR
ncbi:MAG: hypothetical protein CL607_12415 [Anaerolineaceae bacterium]|nr:hypothetical protein [Anaerolineaceae bacterium]